MLVLVMVTFPVLAVIAADVAQATAERELGRGPRPADRLGARRGSTVAARTSARCSRPPTPTAAASAAGRPRSAAGDPGRHRARRSADRGRASSCARGRPPSRPTLGVLRRRAPRASTCATPLAHGLFRLTSGRWPTGAGRGRRQRAPWPAKGFAVGDTLDRARRHGALTVVGIAESTSDAPHPLAGRRRPTLLPCAASRRQPHLAGRRRAGHVGPGPRAQRARRRRCCRAHVIEHPPHDRAAAAAGARGRTRRRARSTRSWR